ncbi:MAG TPA: hypothetical protein VK550_20680 [Polyangiaceae bacterium]|nr:hypothetical protein [Polyangiaceae bacterium]
MIAEASDCRHPSTDAAEDLYCAACGTFVVEGLERCGAVDGDFLCLEPKGQKASTAASTPPSRGMSSSSS